MSTSIDFKRNKLLYLSVVILLVAVLATFFWYQASKDGVSIEEKVLDGITATNLAWGKESSAPRILPKLKEKTLSGSKIDTTTLLHLPNVTFASLDRGDALTADLKNTLATELGDGTQKKLILLGDKYDPTTASTVLRLKDTGEAVLKWPNGETNLTINDLKQKESLYKGIKTTGMWFWPFTKSEVAKVQSETFPKSTILEIAEDKYFAILESDIGLANKAGAEGTNGGSSTKPKTPVINRVLIPATILINGKTYNLHHVGEELSDSNRTQDIEENVDNGRHITNITLTEGSTHNVVGNINRETLVCATGYSKQYNTELNKDVCEEDYIIPGTLEVDGKSYTLAKGGEKLTPTNNQSAGTAPTPDNKGTINANIGLTKWPNKTVLGRVLSYNISCQTGYIQRGEGCVKQETTYTLPNAYVGPETWITFRVGENCRNREIRRRDGEITCDAIVEDYRGRDLTLNNSIKVSLNEEEKPVVKLAHDTVLEYTVPNSIEHDGHTWELPINWEVLTNKWYGKNRTIRMKVSTDLAWWMERSIPWGTLKANAYFVMNPNGLIKKLGGNPKAFCRSGYREQGLTCVKQETPYTLPNAYVGPVTWITFNLTSVCAWKTITASSGKQVCDATTKDLGNTTKTFTNSLEISVNAEWVPTVVFKNDVEKTFTIPNTVTVWGHTWNVLHVTNKRTMTNKFYGKFRDDDMLVWISNPWGLKRTIPNWFVISDYEFNFHVDGTVDKVLNTSSRLICDTNFKAQGNACVASCDNPIYLDSNWITVKAKACAVAGKTYQWNWDNWYVARDSSDIQNKIFRDDSDKEGLWEFKANRIITSKVTNMSSLFKKRSYFNQDIANWDTSNVFNMAYMFHEVTFFNQHLDKWDTSNVEDMSWMFAWASFFNKPLSNWNTRKVKTMQFMFAGASSFNQDISNWSVNKVVEWDFFVSRSPIEWTYKVPAKFR